MSAYEITSLDDSHLKWLQFHLPTLFQQRYESARFELAFHPVDLYSPAVHLVLELTAKTHFWQCRLVALGDEPDAVYLLVQKLAYLRWMYSPKKKSTQNIIADVPQQQALRLYCVRKDAIVVKYNMCPLIDVRCCAM